MCVCVCAYVCHVYWFHTVYYWQTRTIHVDSTGTEKTFTHPHCLSHIMLAPHRFAFSMHVVEHESTRSMLPMTILRRISTSQSILKRSRRCGVWTVHQSDKIPSQDSSERRGGGGVTSERARELGNRASSAWRRAALNPFKPEDMHAAETAGAARAARVGRRTA